MKRMLPYCKKTLKKFIKNHIEVRIVRLLFFLTNKHYRQSKGIPRILPGLSIDGHIEKLNKIFSFFEANNVDIRAGRLPIYKKFLLSFKKLDGQFDPCNNEEHAREYDSFLYVLREIHDLMWIIKGFSLTCPPGTNKLLSIINGGMPFAKDDHDCRARNFQFEMRIASYFLQQGFHIDLSSDADVKAEDPDYIFIVECKRLHSPKQVNRRINEAADQLRRRLGKCTSLKHKGAIAAFDITSIAYPHLGVSWGFSPDHSRENIRKRINEVSSTYDFVTPFSTNKHMVGVWLFVHMPSGIITTGQAIYISSTLFHVLNSRSLAFKRFRSICNVDPIEKW